MSKRVVKGRNVIGALARVMNKNVPIEARGLIKEECSANVNIWIGDGKAVKRTCFKISYVIE